MYSISACAVLKPDRCPALLGCGDDGDGVWGSGGGVCGPRDRPRQHPVPVPHPADRRHDGARRHYDS
eukprot:1339655-Rhodomonas_salina.2